jgi:hypothetical protein
MAERDEEFSAEASRKRFEAALKGARLAGHKPMEGLTKKKAKAKKKSARKTRVSSST